MSSQPSAASRLLGSFFELLAVVTIVVAIVFLFVGNFQIGGVYYNAYNGSVILLLLAVASTLQAIYLNRRV